MSRARTALAAAVWLSGAAALLLAFAGIGPSTPLSAQHELEVPLDRFEPAGATLAIEGEGLKIGDAGAPQVFAAAAMTPFDAATLRHLEIDIEADSVLLQALFAWNVDGRWHSLPLPGFVDGSVTADLAALPEWSGQVQTLGIAVVPIDMVAVQHAPARAATLHGLRLRSDSAAGAFAALRSAWTAYRPWNGRSNHTSGYELGKQPGPSLTGFVAALAMLTAIAAALLGRAAAVRRACAVAVAVLAVWQVAQLAMRADVAWTARRAVAEGSGWPLSGMPALAQEALEIEPLLAQAPPPRIAIWGANGFYREYPAWLLRRFNVGSLRAPEEIAALRASPLDAMLLLVGDEGWSYAAGELQFGGATLRAEQVHDGRLLNAFRLVRDGAP